MSLDPIQKSFINSKKNKDVKYLSKDFSQYRDNLINFTKTYFPNTYRDFSETSPGMLFIEMSAYVGDILSYYIDYQFKESLMIYAEERKNLISLSRYLGYKVKPATAATTLLDVFQLLPSLDNGEPNYKYALTIQEGMEVSSPSGATFRTLQPVNFNVNTLTNPTEITVYSRDNFGNPLFFLLKKSVLASSGKVVRKTINVFEPVPFFRYNLGSNVIEVLKITDSDNNRWYETEYLAQDLVLIDVENISKNDQIFSQYRDEVPYIMKTLRTSRKFITIVDSKNDTYLEFGGGTEAVADELILPNLNLISRGGQLRTGENLDPSNFLKTKLYGQAPANTVLTVDYIVGGGIQSNVNSGELTNITNIEISNDVDVLNTEEQNLLNTIRSSVKVTNPIPATGGADAESDESIRQNALASFMAQGRAVTKEDYIVRALSMPSKYGSIAKVYITQDNILDLPNYNFEYSEQIAKQNELISKDNKNNPFALNMYLLGYDKNKKLVPLNIATKYNLRHYLNKYRILTDAINLLDGYVINLGVHFEIIVYKNYNKKEVLNNCIIAVSEFFDIEYMEFCKPLNISALKLEIAKIEGVQSVHNLEIKNLTIKDGNYSEFEYDISLATKNEILYPSIDPSVFEVKYPNKDITGRVL